MEASFEHLGPNLVIALKGRLDTLTAPQFDEQMATALAQPWEHIYADMSGVSYISSAGVRSILQLVKLAQAKGCMIGLFSMPDAIRSVMDISGVLPRVDVYADRAAALGHAAS